MNPVGPLESKTWDVILPETPVGDLLDHTVTDITEGFKEALQAIETAVSSIDVWNEDVCKKIQNLKGSLKYHYAIAKKNRLGAPR
ncbi:MAG: hypothetical protein ACQEP8_00510 [Chlamydiota bacterium]